MNYLAFLLLTLCAVWVYWDSRHLNARARQQGLDINLQPIPWALLTLALWIAFFPLYLYNRYRANRMLEPELPTGAVAMKSSSIKPLICIVAAIIIAGGWAAWSYATRLPDCSNENTVALLNKVVRIQLAGTEDPKLLEHFNALVKVNISSIETLEHTKDPERYHCAANVNVDLGPEVGSLMGMDKESIKNPNMFTALILGPMLKEVYGPLDGLRVKFTSSWAKENGETLHYVSARLSNSEATGYATLTESAWARMQERSAAEKAAIQTAPQSQSAPVMPQPQSAAPAPEAPSTQVSKAPEAPSAESAMPGRTVDVRTTVQNLSAAWLQAMSDAQTGDEIAVLYADQVNFYGKPNVTRAAIAKEKAGFVRRWAERRYQASGRPALISGTADTAIWSQTFSYKVSDGQKTNSGQSTLEFTAKRIGNEWLIVAEKKAE